MDSHLDGVSRQVTTRVKPHDAKVRGGRGVFGAAELAGEEEGEVCVRLDELGGVVQAAAAVKSRFRVVILSIMLIGVIACEIIFRQVICRY